MRREARVVGRLEADSAAPFPKHSMMDDAYGIFIGIALACAGIAILSESGLITGGIAGMALLGSFITDYSTSALVPAINVPFLVLALFNELRRLVPEVTQRMLTLQLRELETDRIIHREIYREVPPKVEYSLTELGLTLVPLISAMREWGAAHEDTILRFRLDALPPDQR